MLKSPNRVVLLRRGAILPALLLCLGGTRVQSTSTPLSAETPMHLARSLAAAVTEGSPLPSEMPDRVEWRFDQPQPQWQPVAPMNLNTHPLRAERTEDALRLSFDESNDNGGGILVGGIAVEVPAWNAWDWGTVVVLARSRDDIRGIGVGFNSARGQPSTSRNAYAYAAFGDFAATVNDGTIQTYRLRVHQGQGATGSTWQRLGIWILARSPASIDILSISVVPTEAEYSGDPVGVAPIDEGEPDAIYVRAPGRVEYELRIPDDGRLDVGLGVLRDDVPVTFRIAVTPEGGSKETLLEETWRLQDHFASRSIDLSRLAGQTVRLALEAASTRPGTVALWRSPTLYTPGRLVVNVVDRGTGSTTAARVLLTDAAGERAPIPPAAVTLMYGFNDRAVSHDYLPNGAFYTDGSFEVELLPGSYGLSLSKGYEYLEQEHEIVIEAGKETALSLDLERWIDMPSEGWFSADDHIHIRRSPREDPLILSWIAAEDIHVGALLQMGDFWATYYAQYAWGRDGAYQLEDHLLISGQEDPRTHELGHTISLAADDYVRFSGEYYHYDRVFDRVHELGGVTGYAHQGVTFHGYRGLTLDVLRKKVDFIELLQFCASDGPLQLEHYYHFLDLGFPLTATAGSDFPWCGRGPGWNARIGDARFYTYLEDELSFDNWRESLRAGHTFVTSGPVVEITVNGAIPGDTLDVAKGSVLEISARARGHASQVPLQRLEIVAHGQVVQAAAAGEPGQSAAELSIELDFPVEHGVWIAARVTAGPTQEAHTTPVYVSVEGSGFHNPRTVAHHLDLSDQYLDELEQEIAMPNDTLNQLAWRYREGLELRIAETRAVIARLRRELASDGS